MQQYLIRCIPIVTMQIFSNNHYIYSRTSPRRGRLNIKCLTNIGIPILKIKRSHDRLILNMGVPIPVRRSLYWHGAEVAIQVVLYEFKHDVYPTLQLSCLWALWHFHSGYYNDTSTPASIMSSKRAMRRFLICIGQYYIYARAWGPSQ